MKKLITASIITFSLLMFIENVSANAEYCVISKQSYTLRVCESNGLCHIAIERYAVYLNLSNTGFKLFAADDNYKPGWSELTTYDIVPSNFYNGNGIYAANGQYTVTVSTNWPNNAMAYIEPYHPANHFNLPLKTYCGSEINR